MILIEIIPNLWIGDKEILKYNVNVDFIINTLKDLHFLGKYNQYRMDIKNNLEKYEIIKMYEYLNETSEFIFKKLNNNKSVLVICESGNQKSCTIVAAYLIKYGKISLNTVIKSLRTKFKSAFYPNIDYKNSLDMFESKFLS